MSPDDVARLLRSLSGALDEAARGIDWNRDTLDLDWADVDGWIGDLTRVRTMIEEEGRG